MYVELKDFYKNKKVLVTGHTGFKGTWMCRVLTLLGAEVVGYSLEPPTTPSLFELLDMKSQVTSVVGDVRDLNHLLQTFETYKPEIVIHMAAQPIVRESYKNPAYTYEVNVMGTVNILESVRLSSSVKSFLNVTTDKVYKNQEREEGYREDEELNGYDPYSNSKSCSELVTDSYKKSFFEDGHVAISTARAGNVIGGGDFAADRIIPDCVRAIENDTDMLIRNPHSIRPYQHVIEPICAYLMIAMRQYEDRKYAGSYNVGPDEASCVATGELVEAFAKAWRDVCEKKSGAKETVTKAFHYSIGNAGGPHEANFLKLDCTKLKTTFGWSPKWTYIEMLEKTAEWTKAYLEKNALQETMDEQINSYLAMF